MRLVILAALLVAACQQAPTGRRPDPAKASGTPTVPVKPAAKPAKRIGKAVLQSDGIIFDGPGGKTGLFAFGSPRMNVEASAARRFGPPETSTNGECGAGPMEFSRYGPLTLNFQKDKLVGWLARQGAEVVTFDGIAPGKLMRDLKVARAARMLPGSTLEGEFEYLAADGKPIGGFMHGRGRDATIESLFAGQTCFFR